MNRSSIVSLLLIACLFVACAKDKDMKKAISPVDAAATPDEMLAKTSPEEPGFLNAQKVARNAVLDCRNGSCNPSVGLLSFVKITTEIKGVPVWDAYQCTASLIAPDILVTNGHCIPMDLGKPGSDCRGRLFITFAKEAGHPEYDKQLNCSSVLLRNKDTSLDGSDYAYIKLERASNRPTLRQSRDGFEHGKTYVLNKVNPLLAVDGPNGKGIAGQFDREACHAMHDTALFEQPLNKQSQSQLLVDCKVIGGNSGSPVLAEDGSLRGVAFAFLRKDLLFSMHAQVGSKIPAPSELANLNLVSNFACLKDPSDSKGLALPSDCTGYKERLLAAKQQAEALKVNLLKPSARKLIAEKKEKRNYISAFDWSLRTTQTEKTGTIAIGIPECVNKGPMAALHGKRNEFYRPIFYVRAEYDRYIHASNFSLAWGSFSESEEVMEAVKNSDDEFKVSIVDSNNGQSDFNGPMRSCAK